MVAQYFPPDLGGSATRAFNLAKGLLKTGLKKAYEWILACIQNYERTPEQLLLFTMRFQKRGGQPMKADLWVRERKTDGLVELILIRAHAGPL